MLVLAHQGGWDEIVLVLAPVGLFAILLYVANRRAAKMMEAEEAAEAAVVEEAAVAEAAGAAPLDDPPTD